MEMQLGLQIQAGQEDAQNGAEMRLDADVLPVVNFSMHQNGAVAIQSVTIVNGSEKALEGAELHITSNPAFLTPFVQHLDFIPARAEATAEAFHSF